MINNDTVSKMITVLLLGVVVFLTPTGLYAQASQDHTVTGTVISSDDGEALPGASVIVAIEDEVIGTTTNLDGEYSLTVPSGDDVLIFSFVGYATQEVAIEGRTTIDITLSPVAFEGDEIVVIGYGAVARRDVTGSVSSVSSEQIRQVPVSDAGQALQGRVSGLTALSSSNRPGEGVTIRVRGRRSLTASNDPLFVVDGIPLEGGLDDINTQDIESIEVLKDASATAIYGSRGANGVVLITTARGGDHATTISYSGYAGFSQAHALPDMMNGEEFARLKDVAGRPFTSAEEDARARGVSTDWLEHVVETGYQQSHQISIQGGDANTQFRVSGNIFDQTGVISLQGYNRSTFRLNLDHRATDRFRIGTSSQFSRRVQDWGSNPYGGVMALNPLAEPFDADGNLVQRPGADPLIWNPLFDFEDNNFIDERRRYRFFGNIYADLDILSNLSYRVNFGPDYQYLRQGVFQGRMSQARGGDEPLAQKSDYERFVYTFENILTFQEQISPNHAVNLTGLFSLQRSTTDSSSVQVTELPYEYQLWHNLGTGETIQDIYSNYSEWSLMSYMLRANYTLMDRYLFTLTGRYDGSSRLAEGNEWGFFPSAAFAWRVSDEPFMADQNLFSELRFRVSYGVTGNTAINPYATRGGLSRTTYAFNSGSTAAFGYEPSSLANPDLVWERSATLNFAVDFALWEDRLAATVELYQTNTTDLLLERQLPITSGFGSVLENIGETENRGFEVNITSHNIHSSDFGWTTNLNLSGNREKIVNLYGTGEDDVGNEWFIGEPLTVFYDHDMIGIWQLDEADEAAQYGRVPGQIKVRDVTGDGSITEADRVIQGSDMPVLSVGFSNEFRYRNFDLSVFVFGSFGHMVYNEYRVEGSTLVGRYNNLNVDYWTEDNPTNEAPKPDGTREYPLNSESRGYDKGDFLKIRNIQLGYNFPVSATETLGIRSARIYANAETPLIFSYIEDGVDPESYGGIIEAGNGPTTRLFTLGIDVNF